MNRATTALLSAVEAAVVVAIGVTIPLVVATLLWGLEYGFAPEWTVYWRGAVDVWLLGHGVDVRIALDPGLAAALGGGDANATALAAQPFVLTIAALGFALLTLLLGTHAGRRIAESAHLVSGTLAALGTTAGLSFLLALSAVHPAAHPSLWQSALLPALVFGIGLAIGAVHERVRHPHDDAARDRLEDAFERIPDAVRAPLGVALRAGAASAAVVVGVAALLVALLLFGGYAQVITLYESLHADALGGVALTLAQLALLPDAVIWCASWLTGPGFALGAGSSIGPLGTTVGPVPALPLLGALPAGPGAFGFAGLAVPLAGAFLAGALSASALRQDGWVARIAAGLGAGVVGGVLLGLLAWASAGAAGPGRLAVVGPDPLAVGVAAAIELAIGTALGLAAASVLPTREREVRVHPSRRPAPDDRGARPAPTRGADRDREPARRIPERMRGRLPR